ncbi:Ff.00g003440.m01.CDS01 [Fusarium sp. VM40]|nr:Ff.00g003440.m01.CDS01 [Fusarium sp. VM40]
MASLNVLKTALREKVPNEASIKPLSEIQYSEGFDLFLQYLGWETYEQFTIPQLSQQLVDLSTTCNQISVLEIGPGPKSVLAYVPGSLRQRITKYTAFEPNSLFCEQLGEWLSTAEEAPFPSSKATVVHQKPFGPDTRTDGTYNIILFCHSLYGMASQVGLVKNALSLLVEKPYDGLVIVLHRNDSLHLDTLVCHRSAYLPDGVFRIKDNDSALDKFASFIAGCALQHKDEHENVLTEWRRVCRAMGRRDEQHPRQLIFDSPEVMMTFTRYSTSLPELASQVPLVTGDYKVKNKEAQSRNPAAVVKPTSTAQVQRCVQWALKNNVGLTVVGGGHSAHCRWPNVVSVDMGAFDQIHIVNNDTRAEGSETLVVSGAGCKTGDIIRQTMAAGLTVPLGARPSVGAGLWLQGGIGHLARLYGLGCDAIVGAVVVSVVSGQVLYVGNVPNQHRPSDAIRPENEDDLLWALKGAGTNFGIVISVIFQAFPAQLFSVRDWVIPLKDKRHAKQVLEDLDSLIAILPKDSSADVYLYCDGGKLHLGVTLLRYSTGEVNLKALPLINEFVHGVIGQQKSSKIVDAVGLFDTEMYMSGMHGGHGGGKTCSFKRCVFLKDSAMTDAISVLIAAIQERPSPLCYFHLLHGGGAVSDITPDATAFGCRDWKFACVITGVWSCHQDDIAVIQSIVRWVYQVITDLLPMSQGVYSADLGPDPRDEALATRAFGPNRRRLVKLKQAFDPHNVLAYACPLRQSLLPQKLVVLVTGEHGAGKDYCAKIWASVLKTNGHSSLVVSISDATKREYAAATGADLGRLLGDRVYKEEHREALTKFYQDLLQKRPRLAEENFINVVQSADVDVLFITGMRDEAPVATFSPLIQDARLIDVYVEASPATRSLRRGRHESHGPAYHEKARGSKSKAATSNYRPRFTFKNEETGHSMIRGFVLKRLLPLLSEDLQKLLGMIRSVPDFPRQGIEFRHVLNICQQNGGLDLCVSLIRSLCPSDLRKVDAVVGCEAGGFIFASAMAISLDIRLIAIREANKLPPPTVSVVKQISHISSHTSNSACCSTFEMDANALRRGASVVVIDDVLATGETLVAVLQLLTKAGVEVEDIRVMVVAEFPFHRGREKLRQAGFGRIWVQSLLCFDGE